MNVGLQNISQFGTLSQTIGLIRTQKHPRVIEIDSTNISHQILQKKISFFLLINVANIIDQLGIDYHVSFFGGLGSNEFQLK